MSHLWSEFASCSVFERQTIIGLDKNCALEMVQAGDVITDYDKLIDRQLECATISTIAGFAKIFTVLQKQLLYCLIRFCYGRSIEKVRKACRTDSGGSRTMAGSLW
ncbi:MAG: hypothetical protein ACLSCV_02885 [Acutalibacteraceae bacterium]